MTAKLIRVDKNGTKYFEDDVCPKCHGRGYLDYYGHIEQGRCFKCGGSGYYITRWKEYTPEYQQILLQKRLKREAKKVPERNQKFYQYNGFNEDGDTWVVLGNTYSIKDELKEAGAKFYGPLGWHFNHEVEGYDTVKVNISEVTYISELGQYYFQEYEEIKKVVDSKKPVIESTSEYVGTIGEKIELDVTYIKHISIETLSYSGYGTEYLHIYTFNDDNGNVLIWKTRSYPEIEEGKRYHIKAMVNHQQEYKGVKQTQLKRVKVV